MIQDIETVRRKSKIVDFFSPKFIFLLLFLPSILVFVLIPDTDFRLFFSSKKSSDLFAVTSFCFLVLIFTLGTIFGEKIYFKDRFIKLGGDYSGKSIKNLLFLLTLISVAAYLVWFLLAISRANGLGNFFEVYRVNPFWVKSYFFATIPGITTLTQLSVATVPLMIAFRSQKPKEIMLIVIVVGLAFSRSIFASERLALIEILLPGAFVLLAQNSVRKRYFVPIGILGFGTLVTFFVLSESRRSFVYTGSFSYLDALYRLFSYYMTSINNGIYVIQQYQGVAPFHFTFQSVWKFPLIGDSLYQQFNSIAPSSFPENWLLMSGNNPEYTTLTAVGEIFIEFGFFAFPVLFFLGMTMGFIFKLSRNSKLFSATYGLFLVGVFEFLREGYLWGVRVFPAYAVFFIVFLTFSVQIRRHFLREPYLSSRSSDQF
jgi:oligosaccharide repeat unit polymerase